MPTSLFSIAEGSCVSGLSEARRPSATNLEMKESEEMNHYDETSDYGEMMMLLYGESSDHQNKQLIALQREAAIEADLLKIYSLGLVLQSMQRNFEVIALYDRGNGSDVEEEKSKSRNTVCMNLSWIKQRRYLRSNIDWQQGPPRTSIRPKSRVKSSIQNRKNKMRR
jgi:hypothetical protein